MPPDAAPQPTLSGQRIGQWAALRDLLPYLWPADQPAMRWRVVLALLCLVLAKVATVYVPLFYKHAVDALVGDSAPDIAIVVPTAAILSYGLARVLSLGFTELRNAVFARVSIRAIRHAALNVFRHLHSLALKFHLERRTGGLSRVIERGTSAIESLLRIALFNVFPTIIEILLVAVILWRFFGAAFAGVTLLTVVGYVVFTLWVTEWRLKFRRQMNEADQEAYGKAIDSLLNYETVKYFGNEDHEASRFDRALRRYENAAVTSQTTLALLNLGQILIIAGGLTLVMYMAAQGIASGEFTVGDFVLVNTYLMQLYQPLNFFGTVYRAIKQNLLDMETLFTLLSVTPDIVDQPGSKPLVLREATIEFDQVSFAYDQRRPILKSVSFRIEAGQTVALVGATGSGKSTVGRLLYRFFDASSGRITIDGQALQNLTQLSVRSKIGVVPQDTVLFNDTMYYNIVYGRPSATPTEVENAAKLANIHSFIVSLPDGYQSQVGERGLKLSGGEKQRIAIARAILKQPAIYLFDEATSALDTQTEREIQNNLATVSAGHTTLVIAHRLSTVRDADQILVLHAGEIVERGNHAELLTLDSRYAALWHAQRDLQPE